MPKTLGYYILYMLSTFRSTENWSHFVFFWREMKRGIEACTQLLYILYWASSEATWWPHVWGRTLAQLRVFSLSLEGELCGLDGWN